MGGRRQSRTLACGAVALLAAAVAGGSSGRAVAGGPNADWTSYLHDASHSSFNAAATAITPADVAGLTPVWAWTDPAPAHGGAATFLSSPAVANGVVYIGDDDGRFYAIRESDRTVLWSRYIGYQPAHTCPGFGVAATATVAPDPATGAATVYENGPDGNLYALDAVTGSVRWTARVDTPSSTVSDYFAWASPLVANGKVYVGVASNCDDPLVTGGIAAFDQRTGARLAFWRSMLDNQPGGDVWSTPAVLPDGSIVATTGNELPTVQTDWADSIVRLNGASLRLMDGWIVPPSQRAFDSDFGGSPTLFNAVIGGVSTPMVAACNKNGLLYAWRQNDLHDGPVWSFDMSPGATGQTDANHCFAAPDWDGSQLIEASGGPTAVGGVGYPGSVRSFNPATGAVRWQTGLPGSVIGSPAEDGAGVVAAPIYISASGKYGIYLLRATDGALVGSIPLTGPQFSQPVFAGSDLLVAGNQAYLTAYDAAAPGPALIGVAPAFVRPGQSKAVTITGSGFTGSPFVSVTGVNVTVADVHVVSPTQITAVVTAAAGAAIGTRAVTVAEPGPVADTCASCLSIVPSTTSTISSSPNPAHVGQPVTFTAVVSPDDGGGTLTFTADGRTLPGCSPLARAGAAARATCTTSSLPAGTHVVTASYSGDRSFGDSSAVLLGGQVVH